MKSRWLTARALTRWKTYTKCNSSLAFNHVNGSKFSVHECYFVWLQVIIDNRELLKCVFPLLTLQNTCFLYTSDTQFTLDCSAVGRIRWKLSVHKSQSVKIQTLSLKEYALKKIQQNKTDNVRITQHCSALTVCLYLIGYLSILITSHYKRTLLRGFSVASNNKMLLRSTRIKCPIFLPHFNRIWFSRQICKKVPNIKFQRNPSSGSRADICVQTDRQTWHDENTSAFRDYVANPKHALQCSLPLITMCFCFSPTCAWHTRRYANVFMGKAMFVNL
jgi:hypothetical protein